MRVPQSLQGSTCEDLSSRWQLDPRLAVKLLLLENLWEWRFPRLGSLRIISGWRSYEEQSELAAEGRPAAADELSTHRSCPATGADIAFPIATDDYTKLEFGQLVRQAGLRWGGGGPLDARGLPIDWPHVDLGPRKRGVPQ